MPKVIGIGLSPFVRKVRVALLEKGVAYDLDPVVPMALPEGFEKISPLRKIPVYQDGDFSIADSSVILAYLERVHPTPALYPSDPQDYARALFFEEYADTKLTEATLPFFAERIVKGKFMQQTPDDGVMQAAHAVGEEVFPWLESQLDGSEALVGGRFGVADISIATHFANMHLGGETIDASRYPKLSAYIVAIHSRPSFKALIEEEKAGIPA